MNIKSIISLFKKDVKTKFKKICIAPYSSHPLCLKRIGRDKIIMTNLNIFINDIRKGQSLDKLDDIFKSGLIVEMTPKEYKQLEYNNDNICERIGSDKNVSFIIGIRCKESELNTENLKILNLLIEKKGWKPLEKNNNNNVGNKNWKGEYFYDTTGGSHFNKREGCVQLANDYYEYASKEEQTSILTKLIKDMLSCNNAETLLNNPKDITKLCQRFNIKKNSLRCIISGKRIYAENFLKHNEIQLCHNESRKKYKCCVVDGTFKTSFNRDNLFWGFKNENSSMGDSNLIEYYYELLQKMNRLNKLGFLDSTLENFKEEPDA